MAPQDAHRSEHAFGESGAASISTLLTEAEDIESKDSWSGFDWSQDNPASPPWDTSRLGEDNFPDGQHALQRGGDDQRIEGGENTLRRLSRIFLRRVIVTPHSSRKLVIA